MPIQYASLLYGNVAFKPLYQDNVNDFCRRQKSEYFVTTFSHLQAHGKLRVLFLETYQMGQIMWTNTTATLIKYHLCYKINSIFFVQVYHCGFFNVYMGVMSRQARIFFILSS